jgi:hypothetical protein
MNSMAILNLVGLQCLCILQTLTLPLTTLVSDLKQKLSSPEYADTPAERQRLIIGIFGA